MPLLSKSESKFETCLRLTKALKDLEEWVVCENFDTGVIYLDSFNVMNTLYYELTREAGEDE